MYAVLNAVALVVTFVAGALAHGHVSGFRANGIYEPGYSKQEGQESPIVAAWSAEFDNGFVNGTGYQSVDINCYKKAGPGGKSMRVAAGSTFEFLWTRWPESHIGPVLTYAARLNGDFTSANPSTLKWVKIQESGYDTAKGAWATQDLIANNNTVSATIPASLIPGNYVLRHEIIALQSAASENGAENYPQCVNVEITGSGTADPEGVLGTELYKPTDPGILFDLDSAITDYAIPGPVLFSPSSS